MISRWMTSGPRAKRAWLSVLVALTTMSCHSQYIQEPWMGGAGEKTKQAWVNPPTPQLQDELRVRLATSQTDR
jgi:hypothetical protein